jgi:hypothetical protein
MAPLLYYKKRTFPMDLNHPFQNRMFANHGVKKRNPYFFLFYFILLGFSFYGHDLATNQFVASLLQFTI